MIDAFGTIFEKFDAAIMIFNTASILYRYCFSVHVLYIRMSTGSIVIPRLSQLVA